MSDEFVSNSEKKLKTAADITTNIKTVIAAIVGMVVGVFFAGVYWTQLHKKIDDAYDFGVKNTGEIGVIKVDVSGLKQFKDDLGRWSSTLKTGDLSGPGGGGRNNPSICPEGMYVVGIESSQNVAGPYCIGCTVNIRVICRPLKTD
jgi:hypothetical protein